MATNTAVKTRKTKETTRVIQKKTPLSRTDQQRKTVIKNDQKRKAPRAKAREIEDRVMTITRIIDAPRERVFKAWSDPRQLVQWWGPRGMTTPVCEMDCRPGGIFHTVMRDEKGVEYPTNGIFLEFKSPERIVFTDAFDEDFLPRADSFLTATLDLEDMGDKTRYIATAKHKSVKDRQKHEKMGFYKGWGESIDRLNEFVSKKPHR